MGKMPRGVVVQVKTCAVVLASLGALSGIPAAMATMCPATTFCVSDTVSNTGTLAAPVVTVTPTGYPDNGSPGSPIGTSVTYTLGDAFGPGQTVVGADFSTSNTGGQHAPTATAPDSGWNFYDDYRFTINPGSTLSTGVLSVTSGSGGYVSDLEVRLFAAGPNGTAPNAPATLGAPSGGTLLDAWSTVFPGGTYLYTLPTSFPAGSYDLQFRGLATGSESYGGNITFEPVPLPAALPLLLSGAGLLGGLIRRRRASHTAA
jgi:hypothetical protein